MTTIKTYDLNTAQGIKELTDFVAERAIDAISSKLGSGFITIDPTREIPVQNWRSVIIDATRLNVLDIVIQKLLEDIVRMGIRTFIRLPIYPDLGYINRIEKNGISIRVQITREATANIHIDYAGLA